VAEREEVNATGDFLWFVLADSGSCGDVVVVVTVGISMGGGDGGGCKGGEGDTASPNIGY